MNALASAGARPPVRDHAASSGGAVGYMGAPRQPALGSGHFVMGHGFEDRSEGIARDAASLGGFGLIPVAKAHGFHNVPSIHLGKRDDLVGRPRADATAIFALPHEGESILQDGVDGKRLLDVGRGSDGARHRSAHPCLHNR